MPGGRATGGSARMRMAIESFISVNQRSPSSEFWNAHLRSSTLIRPTRPDPDQPRAPVAAKIALSPPLYHWRVYGSFMVPLCFLYAGIKEAQRTQMLIVNPTAMHSQWLISPGKRQWLPRNTRITLNRPDQRWPAAAEPIVTYSGSGKNAKTQLTRAA
jgi:hypothetical protein